MFSSVGLNGWISDCQMNFGKLCNWPHAQVCKQPCGRSFKASTIVIYDSNVFFKKWANPSLFLFIFVHFTFEINWQIYSLNYNNWKKHRWCTWDSNPGRQDGRLRQIHWTMAAPLTLLSYWLETCLCYYSRVVIYFRWCSIRLSSD